MIVFCRSVVAATLLLCPALPVASAQTTQQPSLPDAPSTPRPKPAAPPPTPASLAPPAQLPAQAPAQPPAQPKTSVIPSGAGGAGDGPAVTPAQTQPSTHIAPPQTQDPGQSAPNAPSAEPVTTIRVQAREVNLVFTVTDKKGRFVTGLHQQNFGLLDDGYPPLAVTGFKQQTDLPLRVGILLDTSSSIRSRFQFEQQSALEFFLQVLHSNDRAFVAGFDIQTELTQDYTNSVGLLNQGISKLRPGGGTALFDALYKTCRDQMLTLRDENAVRRVLILVSDGDDNYSRALESDAIKMCQRAETIVYSISTNVSPSKDKGDEILRQISDATGGQPFYPTKIEDVATGFHNIEIELRSQYSLQYRPADFKDDGSFRTIYLTALDPRFHVRAKKGYFAPRPQ